MVGLKSFQEYGLDSQTGFLTSNADLSLPADFSCWEEIAHNLPHLILASQLQEEIHKLPQLSAGSLTSLQQLQRAFSLLCFLANGYVWADKDDSIAADRIPSSIAIPLLEISAKLELKPMICHASVVLFNWKPVNSSKPLSLDNIQTLHLYTGSTDESWFYLVTVAMEIEAVVGIQAIFEAFKAVCEANPVELLECLIRMSHSISKMTQVFLRMEERCNPYVFYNRLRKYLTGSLNCDALPNGLFYGDEKTPRKYSGGSAGQSAAIQAFDAALGVQHISRTTQFLREMRNYMPGPHRSFLEDLEKQPPIKSFIESLEEGSIQDELTSAFNGCLQELENFRTKHIQIVTHYILAQSKKVAEKGTGGSGIMDLLKQSRTETTSQQFQA